MASDFPNHELVIAGDGPQSKQLRDLVVSLELQSRVQFVGTVDHRTALNLMAGAAVFALCSQQEPQGIVILEAMAVGSPVVASASGGVLEIVDDSNGLLFPVGDYRELACKLREVLSDDAAAAQLSLAGRATAARFSWKTLASQYEAAYQDAGA